MLRFALGTATASTILLLLPVRCPASGVAVGKICFDGVTAKTVTDESTRDDKGVWADATYTAAETPGKKLQARFILFRKPILSRKEFPSCDSVVQRETERRNPPLLAGRLLKLEIKAHLYTSTSGGSNRIQIDEGGLSATVTEISSGPRPAHGGTVDLRKPSWLVLTNSKRILTDNASGTGSVEISTSLPAAVGPGITEVNKAGLDITNAHVAFADGAEVIARIGPASPSDPEVFGLNLADGRLSLLEGTLSGTPLSHLQGAQLSVGAASLDSPNLAVKHLEVSAKSGLVTATLTNLSGQSARFLAGGTALKYDLASPKLVAERISGEAAPNAEAFVFRNPVMERMMATADSGQVVTASGAAIFTGSAIVETAKASRSEISATSAWTKPNLTAAEFFFPSSTVKTVHWNLSGPLNALSVAGDIDSTVQRFQTIVATDHLGIQLARTKVSTEIRLPIKTDVGAISGSISVADKDQAGVLTAGLTRFHLDGSLIIPLDDIAKTRAEFPIDGIQMGLKAMIATQPFLAGTKPAFGSVGITGRNRTTIALGAERNGLFDIAVDTVTLGEPVIRIGQDGSEVKASLKLNSKGSVLLTSDIASGELLLARGTFEAKGAGGENGLEFHLLEAGKWLDFGGTRVVDPMLTIKELSVQVDKTQAVELGVGEIVDLHASASSISKPRDQARPSEVSYVGTLVEPLTIDRFAAARVKIEKALVIELATLTGLNLHLANADVRFGTDAHLIDGELKLSAVSLQELKVNDQLVRMLQQAHVAASGKIEPGSGLGVNNPPAFTVDIVANGQSDKLTGDGSAHIGAFSGFVETVFDTGFQCYDDGNNPREKLKAPFELNLAITSIDLKAHLRDGRFSAEGTTGPFVVLAHTNDHSQCGGFREHYIVVPEHTAWTYGICTKGFPIVEFYQCKWEAHIQEVSFNWHMHADVFFAALSLTMTAPVVRISEGSLHLCNIGEMKVPPGVVIMAVAPHIDTSYPAASDIINAQSTALFGAAESTAATSLTNGVGFMVSTVGTGLGNVLCIK